MTGEVKRYAFYDRHTGVEVDPTEILPGDTTNDDTFIASADHLAVVEGLRARVAELELNDLRYRWLRMQSWETSGMFVVSGGKCRVKLGTDCPSLYLLDHAIDKELAAIDEAMRGGDGRG